MTEALGQSTAWTGNGDKSGLDGAGDAFVDGDFLGVMKKFHFFAIRILKKKISTQASPDIPMIYRV